MGGAGQGVEGLSRKEKGLLDKDNSVGIDSGSGGGMGGGRQRGKIGPTVVA